MTRGRSEVISCDSRVDSAATATDGVTDMLRIEGWGVNHKRVERIWRQGGAEGPGAAAEAKSAVAQRRIVASG